MSEEILLLEPRQEAANALSDLPARRVETPDQIRRSLSDWGVDLLWVARNADDIGPLVTAVFEMKASRRRPWNHRLLVLEEVSAAQRTLFQEAFRHVLAPGEDIRLLPIEELVEVLSSPERGDRVIGVAVDRDNRLVLLFRGNLETLVVPFSWFESPSGRTRPDFSDIGPSEYGLAVRFGSYEAATDAILYDFDPDYRRRAKGRELELDDSLGGSLRRLRTLRGLKQSDFPGISMKEIGRIERGEVTTPHAATLDTIAKHLGVTLEELRTY